ncbi:hypothetical protein D3C71_1943730 [compost metagenome]
MEVIAAPTKAIQTILVIVNDEPKVARPITINNTAPELIPKIDGEASGFFVSTCMIAPAIARLAPTIAAINARGTRVLVRMRCSLEPSNCVYASHKSLIPNC